MEIDLSWDVGDDGLIEVVASDEEGEVKDVLTIEREEVLDACEIDLAEYDEFVVWHTFLAQMDNIARGIRARLERYQGI